MKNKTQIFFPIVAKHHLCNRSYTKSIWKNFFVHLQIFKSKNQMIKFQAGKYKSELSIETQDCVTFLSMISLFTKMVYNIFFGSQIEGIYYLLKRQTKLFMILLLYTES